MLTVNDFYQPPIPQAMYMYDCFGNIMWITPVPKIDYNAPIYINGQLVGYKYS